MKSASELNWRIPWIRTRWALASNSTVGEPAVVELIGVFGYYALVAMTLNVFAVRRDSDAPLPFDEPAEGGSAEQTTSQ